MVFKMALLLVLEKRNVHVFSVGNILRLFEVQEINKGDIQPDIHDVCRFCY